MYDRFQNLVPPICTTPISLWCGENFCDFFKHKSGHFGGGASVLLGNEVHTNILVKLVFKGNIFVRVSCRQGKASTFKVCQQVRKCVLPSIIVTA